MRRGALPYSPADRPCRIQLQDTSRPEGPVPPWWASWGFIPPENATQVLA